MTSKLRIATWNLCLGLSNKKNTIKQYITEYKLDVCCMQEIDLQADYPDDLLSFPGYLIETEQNDAKMRVGIYIKRSIKYIRRTELEGYNNHIVVIDILGVKKLRIITIYRTFKPQEAISAREKFAIQLNKIKDAITDNTILLGDFNIDYARKFEIGYSNRSLFCDFDNAMPNLGLFQHIHFCTWSRIVNDTLKESILDHVYSNNPTFLDEPKAITPIFGDHLLIYFDYNFVISNEKINFKRDWRFYSKERLCHELSFVDWNIDAEDVQDFWNIFEHRLNTVIDKIVPYNEFHNNNVCNTPPPRRIITLQNARKKYLSKFKVNPSSLNKTKLRQVDTEIKLFYHSSKSKKVRRGIIPGNSKSLWSAVRIAKDQNVPTFPSTILMNGVPINDKIVPDSVAMFFDNKVRGLIRDADINEDVYNGRHKLHSECKFFMTGVDITNCVKSLKVKNSEGYDRIPQRVLIDGIDHLILPLTELFNKIYHKKSIPSQWKTAKVVPIHKKGKKNEISNYRPISNLCSSSKIFEKLILGRIMEIQNQNKVDVTGKQQHGFKKNCSTASAGLLLQSIIANHVDCNKYVVMASLDLSAAFDIVNVNLLLKRLKIIGLPDDVIELIKVWLKGRSFYVNIDGKNSLVVDLIAGTVQGSILGPLLYAIFVSPLFDIADLTNFADDNFVVRWNSSIPGLMVDIGSSLEAIAKWLKGSGLCVNESKTEVCLFHRLDKPPFKFNFMGTEITSKSTINVLGVLFDSKLQWSEHVSKTILKANKALFAIKLIKRYFNQTELRTILTSNFYTILYYNSEIWHIPSLNPISKQQLLSASANALKLCNVYNDPFISFRELHLSNSRATPNQMIKYKHALLLFSIFNGMTPTKDWIDLNFHQTTTSRQKNFKVIQRSNFKIGKNIICCRLTTINNEIPFQWLNLSRDAYKLKCKNKFL